MFRAKLAKAACTKLGSRCAAPEEFAIVIPNALVNAVRDRQTVLFAGAGLSVETLGVGRLDLQDAIGAQIANDFPGYDHSTRSLEDVCDEYVAINDRIGLVNELAGLIPKNAAPSKGHAAAVESFRFIITTNWDLLFEGAYKEIGQGYQVLASEEDAPNFNYDQHNLLKIHGSIDRPLTLIATTDDYESYADTHPGLLERVGDLLNNNTVLFVGYGLRDEHVRRLLATIRRKRGEWSRRAYAVGFFDEVRTKLLESRDIQVIAADAQEFLPELAQRAAALST
jgi:NAD-dependent SIR2 family protein deacetylase